MAIEIIIALFVFIAFFIALFMLLKKPVLNYFDSLSRKTIEESIKLAEQKSKEMFRDERERLVEKVGSQLELNRQELKAKKDLILEAVSNMRKEINQSQERVIKGDQKRIAEFENLKTVIDDHKNITDSLRITADNLKKILSNNQLRGSFGQEIAEDLLKMAGFVKGQNYVSQTQQDTTKSIPDFTIFLPDNTKINIDVKFPFRALQRYQETEDKNQRQQFMAEFKNDIKSKLKEITSRDYINPEENTVDFVIMFIPNEMIFSFVYENFPDVWRESIKNKVIMCGPFSFTAILRMVKQAYDNFKYQNNLRHIINHIKTFEAEYEKFNVALDLLGNRIQSASKQYDVVSRTRGNKLSSVVDKIKLEESSFGDNILKTPAVGVSELGAGNSSKSDKASQS